MTDKNEGVKTNEPVDQGMNSTANVKTGGEVSSAKVVEEKPADKGLMDNATAMIDNLCDWKIFWWELLGTMLFAYGICASDGDAVFVSMSLFAAILLVAPFSGGHLNPAVSFGFLIKDAIIVGGDGITHWHFREFFTRCISQFIGACCGGALSFAIIGETAAPSIPSEDWRMLGGYFVGEAFGTFIFVLVILIMTDDRTVLVDE